MAKLHFVSQLDNGEFADLVENLKKAGAESKMTLRRSLWTAGLNLHITGKDWVFDEDDLKRVISEHPGLSREELLEVAKKQVRT